MSDDPSNDDATHSADKPESQKSGPPQQPSAPGVRPVTLKPPVAPPARPAPPAGASPAGASPAGAPPAGAPPAGAKPAAVSGPATIRLKPVARPVAPGDGGGAPRADAAGEDAPTVRLRPMKPVPPAAGEAASSPRPGASPLPPGPKPLKPEQVRAAKAKTSRISLDAALIGGQDDRAGPKTIRLKRPSEAPVGKITSHLGPAAAAAAGHTTGVRVQGGRVNSSLIPPIPSEPSKPVVNRFTTSVEMPDSEEVDAIKPALRSGQDATSTGAFETAGDDEASSITRRKTIRVKRPGAAGSGLKVNTPASTKDAADAGDSAADDDEGGGGVVRMALPVERMHWLFPVLAIASLFVLIASVVVLLAPDGAIADRTAWPSDSPAFRLPGMAPISGRQ